MKGLSNNVAITIREYRSGDSVEDLTSLLNRAYAALAEQGLRYVASWQTPDMTAERIAMGTCLIAEGENKEIVGTVMVYPPRDSECAFYREPGVFHFGKFAVEPAMQAKGVGRLLFDAAEQTARSQGATVFACDTAKPAAHLIALYRSWGFEEIGEQDWSSTNYVSVILAKRL